MSIESEITRIKNNIASAYTACRLKGSINPSVQNSENLAQTINSISGSGSSSKYGLTLDTIIGELDENGTLHQPTLPTNFVGTGIVSVAESALAYRFHSGDWTDHGNPVRGITSITFPDLTSIEKSGMQRFFTYSADLETVTFSKLSTLGSNALSEAFKGNQKLTNLYFPMLSESNFNPYLQQFYEMLDYVNDCTVHFPADLDEIMSTNVDLLRGFGGSNIAVLFDLNGVTLSFNVIGSNNYSIYIDGEPAREDLIYNHRDKKYAVIDNDTKKVYVGSITNLEGKTTHNINIDFTETSHTINVTTDVHNVEVTFNVGGAEIVAKTNDNLNYFINVIGDDFSSTCTIYKDKYVPRSEIIEYENEDLSLRFNLYPEIETPFVRPNLTEDGEMGSDDFACFCPSLYNSSYPAHNAFDDDSDSSNPTYFICRNYSYNTLYFYNPESLLIKSLTFSYTSSSYRASQISLYGSNDNVTYKSLGTIVNNNSSIVHHADTFLRDTYKYFKLVFNAYSSEIRLSDIKINGVIKKHYTGIKYNISSNQSYSVYFNGKQVTNGVIPINDDMELLEVNNFKVMVGGKVAYEENVDLNDIDLASEDESYYKINVNLNETQTYTLKLNTNSQIASIKYFINGVEADETSTQITALKGSRINYVINYADSFYYPSTGKVILLENTTLSITPQGAKVDLHPDPNYYGWQNTTTTNPTNYAMYESTNCGVASSYAIMKVTFKGHSNFTCYINSFAESSCDYTNVTNLDVETNITNSSSSKASTSNFQRNPTVFCAENYKTVTFSDLDGNEHFFYVIYRKDSSVDNDNDRGYLIIDLDQKG